MTTPLKACPCDKKKKKKDRKHGPRVFGAPTGRSEAKTPLGSSSQRSKPSSTGDLKADYYYYCEAAKQVLSPQADIIVLRYPCDVVERSSIELFKLPVHNAGTTIKSVTLSAIVGAIPQDRNAATFEVPLSEVTFSPSLDRYPEAQIGIPAKTQVTVTPPEPLPGACEITRRVNLDLPSGSIYEIRTDCAFTPDGETFETYAVLNATPGIERVLAVHGVFVQDSRPPKSTRTRSARLTFNAEPGLWHIRAGTPITLTPIPPVEVATGETTQDTIFRFDFTDPDARIVLALRPLTGEFTVGSRIGIDLTECEVSPLPIPPPNPDETSHLIGTIATVCASDDLVTLTVTPSDDFKGLPECIRDVRLILPPGVVFTTDVTVRKSKSKSTIGAKKLPHGVHKASSSSSSRPSSSRSSSKPSSSSARSTSGHKSSSSSRSASGRK